MTAAVIPFPLGGASCAVLLRGRRCRLILDASEPETAFDVGLADLVQRTGRTFWLEREGRSADEVTAAVSMDGRQAAYLNGLLWPLQGCEIVVGRNAIRAGFLRDLAPWHGLSGIVTPSGSGIAVASATTRPPASLRLVHPGRSKPKARRKDST